MKGGEWCANKQSIFDSCLSLQRQRKKLWKYWVFSSILLYMYCQPNFATDIQNLQLLLSVNHTYLVCGICGRNRGGIYQDVVELWNKRIGSWKNENMYKCTDKRAEIRLTKKNIRGCGSFLENLSSIPSLISFCIYIIHIHRQYSADPWHRARVRLKYLCASHYMRV